jgi:hypothetical protein
MNNQEGCERCVSPNISLGSIIPNNYSAHPYQAHPNTSNINWPPPNGHWITPNATGTINNNVLNDGSPHEFVWNDIVGGNYISRPPLSGDLVTIHVILPDVFNNKCCCDTINFCIRWTFTDVTCKTCDTLICYTITRCGRIIKPHNPDDEIGNEPQVPGNETQIGEIPNTDLSAENSEHRGQTAGIVNVDVNNSSNVKITIFDSHGKEIKQLFNDYLKEGQYSFDLNNYNLPEGVYYYKSEYNYKTEYNKILVTKPVSGCNCGR